MSCGITQADGACTEKNAKEPHLGGLAFQLPGALREPVAKSATPVTYLPYSYVTEQKLGRSHFKSECGVGGKGELGWVGILCNGLTD